MQQIANAKYILIVIIGALAVVIGFRYEEYVVRREFTLLVNAPCDPSVHICFVSDCSPKEDPGCYVGPYEKVEILSREAPVCLEERACSSFTCDSYKQCSISFCDESSLENGESCVGPGTTNEP